jgi:hypothetical protein
MILDGLEGDPSAACDAAGLFFVLWAVENSAATRSHFQAIIHATN